MKIDPKLSIQEVIEQFSKVYPGLKLELYSKEHEPGKGTSQDLILDHSMKLGDVNPSISSEDLALDPQMTVAELENVFKSHFGLNVQVFRRSNKLWLQTSATDKWTLEVQNRKGLHSVQE
jgi:hypothetical protein